MVVSDLPVQSPKKTMGRHTSAMLMGGDKALPNTATFMSGDVICFCTTSLQSNTALP